MNIDKMIIVNFKNYIGEHHFELNKKVTVIVGKNGFGKSSFFDAIEWCLTGHLSRFSKKEFNTKDVLNYDQHGVDKECKVIIFFNGNKLERKFKYKDNKLGNVKFTLTKADGKIINGQANIDNYLRNNYFRTKDENSDIFGNLIKHSHLLSQDQVTDFILKDNPRDRFKSLAEIMGLKNVLFTIENYNQIKKEANNRIVNLNQEIRNLSRLIKERRADLTQIEHSKIRRYLSELGINKKYRDSFNVLEVLKKDLEEREFILNREKENVGKYLQKGFTSFQEVNGKLGKINKQKDQLEVKIRESSILKNKVSSLHNSLENQSHKFLDLDRINNQIKRNNLFLEDKAYSNLSIEEIKDTLHKENQEFQKIDFSKSYRKNYKEMELFLKRFPIEKVKLEKKSAFLIRRSKRINNVLSRINERISEHDTGIIVKLLDHIKGIQGFVEGNNHAVERCPVCSVEHGENLPHLINTNISYYKDLLNNDTALAEKYLSLKKRLFLKKDNVDNSSIDITEQLENLVRTALNYKKQLDKIKKNKLFTSQYIELEIEMLNKLSEEKNSIVSSLNDILAIKLELENLNKELITLKKILGTTTSTKNLLTRKTRIKRAEQRLLTYIVKKQNELKALKEEHNQIYKEFPDIEKSNDNLPFTVKSKQFDKDIIKIQRDLDIIVELINYKYTLDINKKIGADIKKYYYERKNITKRIQKLSELCGSITSFMNRIQGVMGNETTSFLNAPNSLIQKYYRYLNPMSNSKGVQFESESGELNIYLPIEGKKNQKLLYNAKHTLSSGQLNVLAISIFLAINESQKVSKLDFIGIDDPIQNMDNVNRFSICDVLSQINKQLILTTHDVEFVKLLVKKSQHIADDIQVFLLESPSLESGRVKKITF